MDEEKKKIELPIGDGEIELRSGTRADGSFLTIKITPSEFIVRGNKVPVDENEALTVYKAFVEFLNVAQITNAEKIKMEC